MFNGGEQFKSAGQSPNFYTDIKNSSPSYQRRSASSSSEDVWSQVRNASLETNVNAKRDADGIHPPQVSNNWNIIRRIFGLSCRNQIIYCLLAVSSLG